MDVTLLPMSESRPSLGAGGQALELGSEHLMDDIEAVEGQRASLVLAAANARSIAMLTGTHGVVALPLDRATIKSPTTASLLRSGQAFEAQEGESELAALLRARVSELAASGDAVGLLRARLELAFTKIDDGDREGAIAAAKEAAGTVEHAPSAHALLRMLNAGRASVDEQLTHVTTLAAHAENASVRADFLTEKARLLEARGGPSAESAAAYVEALGLVPDHVFALQGLEATLDALGRHSDLAAHFGRLAGLAGDRESAAWLHVERALLLDRRLGDESSAKAALDHALELQSGIGPVRQAALDHAVLHRDSARIGTLLESEAAIEKDSARAARLELDAALALVASGAGAARVVRLLERAHGRAPTSKVVDARVAVELARIYDAEGKHEDALRVRKTALKFTTEPREELLALRAIATDAERAGAYEDAVLALERARMLEGEDTTLLTELDRLLVAAGRHEHRSVLWVRESALADEPDRKARALLLAAEASRAAGRDGDASRHLQAAWVASPGAPGVFDALADRLGQAASGEGVGERVALYEQAAFATKDPARRLYYLEKIAWLWDDVAGDAERAARAYEDVLAIDDKRSSAISGLASAASRAGDTVKVAKALLAEAARAVDEGARDEARLRAAEALTIAEPERALRLAESLQSSPRVGSRAGELVTRLHASGGRWELVARSLAERASNESKPAVRLALKLAEAQVRAERLASPEGALEALASLRDIAGGDPAFAHARLTALEAIGDHARLRAELETLGEEAERDETKAARFVRAAELEESREGGDAEAVRLYLRAKEALPDEPLIRERLFRLGARADVPEELVPVLVRAVRLLDVDRPEKASAEPLLASASHDVATLRTAERLARRAGSAPQLANALALGAQASHGMMAKRALGGLAALVAWTLPESDELEPWGQLLSMGIDDAVVLDDLVRRAWPRVRTRDPHAVHLALEATKRRLQGVADRTDRLMLVLEVARLCRLSGAFRESSTWLGEALRLDRSSVTAAILLARVASEIGDRGLAIGAATALADVVVDPKERARLLQDAADLSAAEKDTRSAATLLERALEADPDNVLVAARLAQIQAERGAFPDLARALRKGVHAATTKEAIVPMASELADVARNKLQDPLLAIEALECSRQASPTHVPALFLLAELYIGQRAWQKALEALAGVVVSSSESDEKLTARIGRASILARVQNDPKGAEIELRAALEIDAHEPRAIRAMLKLPGVVGPEERATLLSRLVVSEPQGSNRISSLLELADIRRSLGDAEGAEGALVEAASISPDPSMFERLRVASGGDASTAVRLFGRALSRAREGGVTPGAGWLAGLGDLELGLGRVDDAIEHFEEALSMEPQRDNTRLALARALAAKGRHETAAAALSPLLDRPSMPVDVGFVRLLASTFEGSGRTQQAMVANELRAIAGDLDARSIAALDQRRLMPAANSEAIPARSLRSFVMPPPLGAHPIWDVAQVATGIYGKLARVGVTEQGGNTKSRIKPKAIHPLRQLFDRVARCFDLLDVEIAVSDQISAPTLATEDVPWVIVPAQIADWPEPYAIAALARPLVRVALAVPWVGALDIHDVLAILVALGRQVAPAFGATPPERIEPLVGDYELRVRRAIDRRRRRSLEELEPSLDGARLVSDVEFADAVARTEARAAFLLSGDLRASLEALATTDHVLADALRAPSPTTLHVIMSRPVTRDLVTFALSGDATALRRSLGTLHR